MTLERPTFSTTSMREGYDTEEVDRAVDLVLDNLALPELRFGADQITSLRFTPVRLQQGYDMGEVDSWLDLAAAETARRSTGGVDPEQQPATTAPDEAPDVIVDLDARAPETVGERVQLLARIAVLAVSVVLLYLFFR
ncbi:DivIVA domain-containing protein [Nocardioides sp.]|uniref:DivIVA domain-containing protein n=1 Tax=Nocardioides sp. TaxID=35761 RepID=UPI0035ADEC95